MAAQTERDLFDWITGFGSLEQRMKARLDRPVPGAGAMPGRLSGTRLGWRDLGFEQLELAAGGALPAARPGFHRVVLGLGAGAIAGSAPAGRRYEMRPGSVLVLPAGGTRDWRAASNLHCCLLSLDARVLERVAQSAYGAGATDFGVVAMHVDYDLGIIGLGGVLAEEAMRGVRGNNLYVNSLASHLAVHLLRHYAKWGSKAPADRQAAFERALNAPEPVQRAVVHIREHHMRDLGAQEIAEAAGENAFVLRRLFYESLGTEPGQYVLQLRMHSAESLLAAGARSLPEVANAVGFGDPNAVLSRSGDRQRDGREQAGRRREVRRMVGEGKARNPGVTA